MATAYIVPIETLEILVPLSFGFTDGTVKYKDYCHWLAIDGDSGNVCLYPSLKIGDNYIDHPNKSLFDSIFLITLE